MLFDETGEIRTVQPVDEGEYRKAVLQEHQAILSAIQANDPRRAQEAMGRHLAQRLEAKLYPTG